MTIREQLELRELEYLSSYAALSKDSKGRKRKEEPCDIRPAFQRDRDRILHCKAFRRLKQRRRFFFFRKEIIIERGLHIRWKCPRMRVR